MPTSTQKPDKKGYKKASKKHTLKVYKEIKRLAKLWRAGEMSDDEHRAQVECFRVEMVAEDKVLHLQFNIPLPPYMK